MLDLANAACVKPPLVQLKECDGVLNSNEMVPCFNPVQSDPRAILPILEHCYRVGLLLV